MQSLTHWLFGQSVSFCSTDDDDEPNMERCDNVHPPILIALLLSSSTYYRFLHRYLPTSLSSSHCFVVVVFYLWFLHLSHTLFFSFCFSFYQAHTNTKTLSLSLHSFQRWCCCLKTFSFKRKYFSFQKFWLFDKTFSIYRLSDNSVIYYTRRGRTCNHFLRTTTLSSTL